MLVQAAQGALVAAPEAPAKRAAVHGGSLMNDCFWPIKQTTKLSTRASTAPHAVQAIARATVRGSKNRLGRSTYLLGRLLSLHTGRNESLRYKKQPMPSSFLARSKIFAGVPARCAG